MYNKPPKYQLSKQYNASNESPFTARDQVISEVTADSDEVIIQLPSPSFRIEVASPSDHFQEENKENY